MDAKPFQKVPADSVDFLLQESFRQHQGIVDSKDSIDTRASFMLGLLGVIATILTGVFVSFWTSSSASNLLGIDPAAWWLGLTFTCGVVVTLVIALVLEIWVLFPRWFAAGIELTAAYKYAAEPLHDILSLKEQTLRAMIGLTLKNIATYVRDVEIHEMASLVTVISLIFSSEFVIVILSSGVGGTESSGILWAGLVLLTVAVLSLGGYLGWRIASESRMARDDLTAHQVSLLQLVKSLNRQP